MADSSSSPINDNITVPMCDTENSSTNEKVNDGKRKMTPEQYRQLTDKLLEMEQIKCEERLVYEEINRLNAEKQHLQNLLNILHVMDSNERTRNSRCRPKRLHKLNSNSHLN